MKKLLAFFLLFLATKTFSQTTIDDGSLVSGTWTKAASPYLVNGSIMIPGGETLMIEPGVQINFIGYSKFIVAGKLLAVGNSTDSISFSPVDSSIGWLGISFENANNTDSSFIKFCKINYAITEGVNGAGISISNSFKIAISNSNINHCNSTKYGGAICSIGSDPVITNNTILYNHSIAGAIFLNGGGIISNNYIAYNDNILINDPGLGMDPDNYGAGIVAIGNYPVSPLISNNIITQNISALNGGGITVMGYVDVINNTVTFNQANSTGGGIYCLDCTNISNNIIKNNTASISGGIHIYNNADIDVSQKNLDSNIISNNTAQYGGGGITINGGWQIYLTRNKICNNTVTTAGASYQGGGGVWITSADNTVQFSDNIISNNNSVNGAGILFGGPTSASFFNNTITNNAASSKGGGLYFYSSSPEFYSNILWGNTAVATNGGNQVYLFNEASDPNFYNNDIQGSTPGFGKNGTFFTGKYQNNINSNPGFVSPTLGTGNAYNGITADWSLQDTSKCLNAGFFGEPLTNVLEDYPESKDILGHPREVNCKIDLGAIENQTPIILPSSIGFSVSDYPLKFYPDTLYGSNNPLLLYCPPGGGFLTNNTPFKTNYWSTGETTWSILINQNGVYKSRSTTTTGCSFTDSTYVIIKPSANFTINKDTQCLASNNFIFTSINNIDTANYNYKWNFGDNLINTNYTASHTYATAGNYSVKLIVSQKKYPATQDSLIKKIRVDSFIYNSLPDTTIVEDDSVIIDGGIGFASYLWNNNSTSQSIIVKTKGWYKVTVTNANGCSASDSSYVLFKKRKTLFIDKSINNCPNAPGVTVSVKTANCTNIVGLQGTIAWDKTKLKFNNIVYNSSNINITSSDLNLGQINNGLLTLSWLDNTLTGKTESDSTKLFSLNFDILPGSTLGTQIPITFNSSPTALEIDTVNLNTNTLVKVLDPKFINGYVQLVAAAQSTNVTLEACDSIIYKGIKYFNSTSIIDTLKYTQGCDSIYINISFVIYHTPITPTISIRASYNAITYGEHVTFTASFTKGGPTPIFKWYKNGVVINGVNSSSYSTDTLNANDTIRASIVSSFSCAVPDTIFSNKYLLDVSYLINGQINHILGATVPNTTLNLNGINYSPLLSNSFTRYLVGGKKYKFKFYKSNDVVKTNGVSTLDIALVQSHILNITPFNDPYKLLAADVDKNGEISALDILHIRRLILGITSSFPSNNLWLFIDSTNINQTNPFPAKDSITIDSLMSSGANLQFVGIKLGDVNFDWNPVQARPAPLSTTPITLYHNDIKVDNNGEIRIPVRVKDFKDIIALQYTMSFNQMNMRFNRIENNLLNIQFNAALSTDGKITFIWNDPKNAAVNIDDNTVVMEIIFNKQSDFYEEVVDINSDVTAVEAWDSKLQKHMINYGGGKILNTINWSITPNPTKGEINLNITSSKNKKIIATLQDITGKTIAKYPIQLFNGNNQIKLNLKKTTTIPPGTYYIITNDIENKISQKIIIQ